LVNTNQISVLFGKNKSTISRHLNNIYKEEELIREATVAKNATVQIEANRHVERIIEYYNLDVIISIGYRVNSKQGTAFRIWANKILKDHLLMSYSINEKRLREQNEQLKSLKNTVTLLSNVLEKKSLNNDEATGLLKVVTDYAYALDILDKYDHQELVIEGTTIEELFIIDYAEAKQAINDLKEKFGGSALFGNEKINHLKALSQPFIKLLVV
jgi:hypothetical protein